MKQETKNSDVNIILKKLIKEVYKTKMQHNNPDLKLALENAEEYLLSEKNQ